VRLFIFQHYQVMKKLSLLIAFVAVGNLLSAQPWMQTDKKGLIKFSDAVANFPKHEKDEEEKERERKNGSKEIEEDEEYHLGRWEWYWRQHLDDNGYIVPAGRGIQEWHSFLEKQKNTAARTTTTASNWIFEGPHTTESGYGGIGRVNVVAFDPVDSNTVYVGSAAGGTWKTTNGGATWTCLYSHLPSLGVADIKVNPLNRKTVYVATGDGDGGDDNSTGVIKSYDGGLTWQTTGLTWPLDGYYQARSLVINPQDTNKLIVGSDVGIHKSNDGGVTWTVVATGDYRQVLYNLWDTSIVYATKTAGSAAQIMRSSNGGLTWTLAFSVPSSGRVNIAVTPANPAVVKAIVANSMSGLDGIYSSSDNGLTFAPVFLNNSACANNLLGYELGLPSSSCGGQGWYDLCIAVDPYDEDKLIIGGVNHYYSTDGGYGWTLANQWYGAIWDVETVHADKHWLGYSPLTHAIFASCDGGIYKSYAPVTGKWIDLSNGLGITQFYRNAVDNGVNFCLGGAQDNGSKKVVGGTSTDLTGGDGMQPLINYGDPANTFYCAYQNGSIDMTTNGGVTFNSISNTLPTPGAWITPYLLHPTDPLTMLAGYKAVYMTVDGALSWYPISPEFDPNSNIEVLVQGRNDPNTIYLVQPNYTAYKSVIRYTTNMGASWNTITNPFTRYISDLTVDPSNANKIYVTLSGYGVGKVYSYDITSPAWVNMSTGLPDLPVNCILIDTAVKTKYIGTDAAVFYRTDTMTSWALFNNNLPGVHVNDLNINYTTNEIWAATYGRGMWKSVKAEVPTGIATHPALANVVSISPNPCHGAFTIHSTGVSFRNASVNVRLVTTDGKECLKTTGTFNTSGELTVDVDNIPVGFYICEVSSGSTVARNKVMIW
jgi:hypothetical protein